MRRPPYLVHDTLLQVQNAAANRMLKQPLKVKFVGEEVRLAVSLLHHLRVEIGELITVPFLVATLDGCSPRILSLLTCSPQPASRRWLTTSVSHILGDSMTSCKPQPV